MGRTDLVATVWLMEQEVKKAVGKTGGLEGEGGGVAKWFIQSKNVTKQTPPKVDILIPKPVSKFSKLKNHTQKDPLKYQKNTKCYNEQGNRKVEGNRPPQKEEL